MNGVSRSTRRAMLIAAAVIFAAAMIWLAVLESHSYLRDICERINEFGYRLSPADFYSQSFGSDTSIEKLSGRDLEEAKALSASCGFGADTSKTGKVELLLCKLDSDRVLYVYTVDHEPELVFIESISKGTLSPIG